MANKGPIPKSYNVKETRPHGLKPPLELRPDGLAVWEALIPILEEEGRLQRGDLGVVATYCGALGEWLECERIIGRDGMTFIGRGGSLMPRPELQIRNHARATIRHLAAALGLSYEARARMNIAPPVDEKLDPVAQWERDNARNGGE